MIHSRLSYRPPCCFPSNSSLKTCNFSQVTPIRLMVINPLTKYRRRQPVKWKWESYRNFLIGPRWVPLSLIFPSIPLRPNTKQSKNQYLCISTQKREGRILYAVDRLLLNKTMKKMWSDDGTCGSFVRVHSFESSLRLNLSFFNAPSLDSLAMFEEESIWMFTLKFLINLAVCYESWR